MYISIVSLLMLLVLASPCSATFVDLLHSLHSLLRFAHHGHGHGDGVTSHHGNGINRFGLWSRSTPWPSHRRENADDVNSSPKVHVVDAKFVQINNTETARPGVAIGGLSGRMIPTTAEPNVTRPLKGAAIPAEIGKSSTTEMTSAPSTATPPKSTSLSDLRIPGGEDPEKEGLPDYVMFRPLRPLDSTGKSPAKTVHPAKGGAVSLAENSTSTIATPSTESSSTTEDATSVTQAPTSISSASTPPPIVTTMPPSTRMPSTGESARESEAQPVPGDRKGRSQLALDVNDLFQIIE